MNKHILFFLFDILHAVFFFALYGPIILFSYVVSNQIIQFYGVAYFTISIPLVLYLSTLLFLINIYLWNIVLPKIKPGKYKFPEDKMSVYWSIRLAFHRMIFIPVIKNFIFYHFIFRYVLLRSLGTKMHFDTKLSSDVDIFDPELFNIGSGSMLGGFTKYSCHFIDETHLYLKPVVIGENVNIFVGSLIFPGTRIGDNTTIGLGASISYDVSIGNECHIGSHVTLGPQVKIGNNVVIGNNVYIESFSTIKDFSIIKSGVHLKRKSMV